MRWLKDFILSEEKKYQQLLPAYSDIEPQKAKYSADNGLDGWSYMMRTAGKDLALLYFENKAELPRLHGFNANAFYTVQWFDPRTGQWKKAILVKTDKDGILKMPSFPGEVQPAVADWAAKIKEVK